MEVADVERYRKLAALAEQGVGGEKDNAERKMVDMRIRFPGIHEAAFPPASSPAGDNARDKWGWTFDAVKDMLSWAATAAATNVSVDQARDAADACSEIATKANTKSGVVAFTVKISLRDFYYFAGAMTEAQRTAFAFRLGELLAEEIMIQMEESED